MLFSVIIPTYNRRSFLMQALASVRKQRFRDFEVIVIDDGSDDGTASGLGAAGMPIRLVQQANRGPGAARNAGAHVAHGDYLAFLDSDDLWYPWTLGTFAQNIAAHRGPAILAAKLLEFEDGRGSFEVAEEPSRAVFFGDFLASSRSGCHVGAGMTVVHRPRFLATGGFTERRINGEDHDLILRMGLEAGFVQVLSPVTLARRLHHASATAQHALSAAGSLFLIEQESRGLYPGGAPRAPDRRRILTLHTRPVSLAGLKEGKPAESWQLYRRSWRWNLEQGRWKYLVGFPLKALLS